MELTFTSLLLDPNNSLFPLIEWTQKFETWKMWTNLENEDGEAFRWWDITVHVARVSTFYPLCCVRKKVTLMVLVVENTGLTKMLINDLVDKWHRFILIQILGQGHVIISVIKICAPFLVIKNKEEQSFSAIILNFDIFFSITE